MTSIHNRIKRCVLRRYRDNGQMSAYVEWADGTRTEGRAEMYHGLLIPSSAHMGALFDRAIRDGRPIVRETW